MRHEIEYHSKALGSHLNDIIIDESITPTKQGRKNVEYILSSHTWTVREIYNEDRNERVFYYDVGALRKGKSKFEGQKVVYNTGEGWSVGHVVEYVTETFTLCMKQRAHEPPRVVHCHPTGGVYLVKDIYTEKTNMSLCVYRHIELTKHIELTN